MTIAISIAYLVAAVLFILGLKQLSSPRGARNGNFTAALGMVIALGATVPLLHFTTAGIVIVAIGVVVGALIGTVGARIVRMTAIPQMVALFNGVGGGAAALVAVAELLRFGTNPPFSEVFPSVFSIVIGSISFAGSMVAFAKLQELMTGTPITYPGQQIVNGLLAALIVGFAIAIAYLVAAVLFILGLSQLSSPRGARNGNFTAALGMVIAIGATIPKLHFTSQGIEIILGLVAVTLATTNVVGGFVVTDRMLEMFKGRQPARPASAAEPVKK